MSTINLSSLKISPRLPCNVNERVHCCLTVPSAVQLCESRVRRFRAFLRFVNRLRRRSGSMGPAKSKSKHQPEKPAPRPMPQRQLPTNPALDPIQQPIMCSTAPRPTPQIPLKPEKSVANGQLNLCESQVTIESTLQNESPQDPALEIPEHLCNNLVQSLRPEVTRKATVQTDLLNRVPSDLLKGIISWLRLLALEVPTAVCKHASERASE